MVMIRLRGVNPVRDKRTGEMRYYAWRGKGAPRLEGKPGSPEFIASFNAAMESRRPQDNGSIASLVISYKAEAEFTELAASTQKNRAPWLDRIRDYFGKLPIKAFDRAERIKPIIRKWRNQYRETPRTADYGMQTLSALLTFAVKEGRLGANPCFGIEALYDADRSEIIWSDTDIDRMAAAAPAWLGRMIRLAAYSGLRRGDQFKLAWSHIGDFEIEIRTGKSRQKIAALIPLYDDLRSVLETIPKRAPLVLTYDDSGRPITSNGFASAWRRTWDAAGMGGADLHFNDLRGTAATKFYLAGFTVREIAEILGWTEDSVDKIIRRYVGRHAAVKARIERLNEARRGTDFAK